jgi:hypothetical protein
MLIVLMTLFVMPMANGVAGEERIDADGQWKYVVGNGGSVVTGYTEEPTGDVTIPARIDGHPVTASGWGAFSLCGNITLTVAEGSCAEEYAVENEIPYRTHMVSGLPVFPVVNPSSPKRM